MNVVDTTFKADHTATFYDKVAYVAADIREVGFPISSVELASAIATIIEYFGREKKSPPADRRAYSADSKVVWEYWLDHEAKDGWLPAGDGKVLVDRTGKRTVSALQVFK